MSNIQNKLDSLQPFITGIRYVQGIQVVDAAFKPGWNIPDSDVVKKEMVDVENNSFVFYTDKEGVTFDDLLDYVEGIISINIEREKKHELLKLKVKELQEIFKNTPLSKLNTLKFKFNESELIPSLEEMDIDLNEEPSIVSQPSNREIKKQTEKVSTIKKTEESKINSNNNITTANVKGQEIELPPKNSKIELEEFNEPVNIVCKCGPDDVCPICEEEKFS